jgi:hypothetical protein
MEKKNNLKKKIKLGLINKTFTKESRKKRNRKNKDPIGKKKYITN